MRDLNASTISLNQKAYIGQIVAHFGLTDVHTTVTPMEPGVDLSLNSPAVSPKNLTPSKNMKYRQIIGSLMYTTIMTCSNIAFVVSTFVTI